MPIPEKKNYMRILHVINNLGAGGAEKLLTDLLPLFQEDGHEVCVMVCNNKESVPAFLRIFRDQNIEIIDLKTSFYNPFQVFKMARIISKYKFDIVHAHLFPTQYWVAIASIFRAKKVQYIKTEHSVFNERKQYQILRPLEQFIYGRYNCIIAISELVRSNLAAWLGRSFEIEMVHNGVNLNQIQEQKQLSNSNYAELFSAEKFNILMVSRFDGIHKDQVTVVKALAILNDNTIQLLFAGDGPAMQDVKLLVKTLRLEDRVVFLGLRSDVYKLMSLTDLNLLSTNTEGLSGVTLESLASGRPFIGSKVEGVKDVVPDADFLFPPKDPEALAQKITEVKENEGFRRELVQKAADHIGNFDISVMAKKYLDLYKSKVQ
jgi:glycosyltransferase involved in cell wall biosynthesis